MNFSKNEFGNQGVSRVCKAIKENKKIRKLDLSFNKLGDEVMKDLTEALENHDVKK
jgi:Ran GTPase-activating protein (RanGAP) involved in mRNA processing and transport